MRTNTVTDSASSYPTSYDSGYQAYSVNNPTRAYKDSDNTSNYAQVNLTRGEGAITYMFYNFSFNIPTDATITAISCTATCLINRTVNTNVPTREIQLYAGSTAKGTAETLTNSTNLRTLVTGDPSTWSASDVNNAKIRLYAVRGTVNTSNNYYIRFYGATLTVSYTYEQTQYEVTATSDSPNITVSAAQAWVNAGEDYNLDITGDITNADITDNDNDIKSSLATIGVNEYRYNITSISEDHTIVISVRTPAGDVIYIKVSNTWKEAQDVKVKVNGTWQSVSKAYKKDNGSWSKQDKSAMFDPNALFSKG